MIDKKMIDSLQENVKTGKFSSLIKTSTDEAIVKELIGEESFKQFRRLQKLSGELQGSLDKFYNASKSGTTIADVGLAGAAAVGLFTGNPYLILKSAGGIGGLQFIGHLLTDKQFLKYLAEAALTDNKEKFFSILKNMQPSVNRAIVATTTKEVTD